MTWARVDDQFPDHPKVAALSDRAFRVHVKGICYSNRLLTDGFVPTAVALEWGPRGVAELAAALIWTAAPGGYTLHDYLDWNPSKAEVLAARAAKARGGRARQQKLQQEASTRSADAAADAQHVLSNISTRSGIASPAPAPKEPKIKDSPLPSANGRSARVDSLFEALVEVCEYDLGHLTADARGRLNAAAKQLRAVEAEPPMVRGFAIQYRDHWPGMDLTPQAITANWPAFMAGKLADVPRRGFR